MRREAFLTLAVVWVGCTGPRGADGTKGADGVNGADGMNGMNGADGLDGSAGPQGDAGRDGLSAWVVGPGVRLELTDLSVTPTQATVTFTLKDSAGVALDQRGLLTAGAVALSFALGQLADTNGDPGQYRAYTTRLAGDGGTVLQASAENNGTLTALDVTRGLYRYTFAAPLTGFDATRTQTVVGLAERTFDGLSALHRAERSVRPDDAGVPVSRQVAATTLCANCHGPLQAHGGRYDAVSQCVVCHQPQSNDAITGQTLDFPTLVHRIHRGGSLPSVDAGTPFLVGTKDYSTVRYPQSIERCEGCHAGLHGTHWRTVATAAACGSCHDRTAFSAAVPVGFTAHSGGPQPDGTCATCHPPTGGTGPCVGAPCSVERAHLDPSFDPAEPQLELAIDDAPAGLPGTTPSLTFSVRVNGAPYDLIATPLTSLRATLAGPNTDFFITFAPGGNPFAQVTVQGSGASGTLTPVPLQPGHFTYVFPATLPVPLNATGSFTVALEGYLMNGTARAVAVSPVRALAVTDLTPIARRTIVDAAKCDACHFKLIGHFNLRGAQVCTLCHNPENANNERVARFEGSTVVAESVDFRVMIHKIHMGERLTQPYVLGGVPAPSTTNPAGTPINFATTRMPRSPAQCESCHLTPVTGTRPNWTLPLSGLRQSLWQELTCSEDPSADSDSFCASSSWLLSTQRRDSPETAVCTSCHDQPYVAVHAQVNTNVAGAESCATCHGAGAISDVEVVHRR